MENSNNIINNKKNDTGKLDEASQNGATRKFITWMLNWMLMSFRTNIHAMCRRRRWSCMWTGRISKYILTMQVQQLKFRPQAFIDFVDYYQNIVSEVWPFGQLCAHSHSFPTASCSKHLAEFSSNILDFGRLQFGAPKQRRRSSATEKQMD